MSFYYNINYRDRLDFSFIKNFRTTSVQIAQFIMLKYENIKYKSDTNLPKNIIEVEYKYNPYNNDPPEGPETLYNIQKYIDDYENKIDEYIKIKDEINDMYVLNKNTNRYYYFSDIPEGETKRILLNYYGDRMRRNIEFYNSRVADMNKRIRKQELRKMNDINKNIELIEKMTKLNII